MGLDNDAVPKSIRIKKRILRYLVCVSQTVCSKLDVCMFRLRSHSVFPHSFSAGTPVCWWLPLQSWPASEVESCSTFFSHRSPRHPTAATRVSRRSDTNAPQRTQRDSTHHTTGLIMLITWGNNPCPPPHSKAVASLSKSADYSRFCVSSSLMALKWHGLTT